jgi:putative PIG3 family NAD(P)H quinone oxidoreductase
MRVIAHNPPNSADKTALPAVRIIEVDAPTPGPDQVVIKVAYAGVNRPDLLQRRGAYPPPAGASPYMGLEVSGTIRAIGANVKQWQVGQEVCALTPGGGYADEVVTHAGHCMPIPQGFSLLQAAALPETYLTVWANLIERGGLTRGESVLIHGGSSGIGVTAIQIAKWAGAMVYTTVGSEEKAKACAALGADCVINYRNEDWASVIKEKTAGQGVNLILDMVGGPYMEKNLRSLALEGRLVQIAFLMGSKTEVDWSTLMIRRLTFTGSTLRARSDEQKSRLVSALQNAVWPELSAGRLMPQIHSVFPFAEVDQAHALMESSTHVGKIMLKVSP